MKFRSTWILIIVCAMVTAYYFLFEHRREEKGGQPTMESETVLPYNREDVESIVLINPAGERIALERDGEEWMIVHPTRTPASKSTIDAFLFQIVPGLKMEVFPAAANLGDFGFDDPFATVILSAAGSRYPDTIYVGDKTPTSSKCYIRLGSSRDVIITRELTHNVMNKNLFHLRDKNLFDISHTEIDRLTVLNGTAHIILIKREGDWYFDETRLRGDRLTIEQYLNMLTSAIIYGFVREDLTGLARFELSDPFRKIIIGTAEEKITLSFGRSEKESVYAVRSGIDRVLRLRNDLLSIFAMDGHTLRAKEITFADMDGVRGIRAELSDILIAAVNRGAGWRLAGPDSIPVAPSTIKRLLNNLRRIRFEEVFDPSLAPPEVRDDAPSISITLEDESGLTIDQILLAPATAGYEFGSSISAMAVGRLPGGTLARIEQLIDPLRVKTHRAP